MNDSGEMMLNRTAEHIYATAKSMVNIARQRIPRMSNDQVILDPGIMPIGSDSKGDFRLDGPDYETDLAIRINRVK